MGWDVVANLIIQIGFPAAERIVQNWEQKQAVTTAEFANIRQLANQHADDQMKAALQKAGVDPASPQGAALVNLAS